MIKVGSGDTGVQGYLKIHNSHLPGNDKSSPLASFAMLSQFIYFQFGQEIVIKKIARQNSVGDMWTLIGRNLFRKNLSF